MTAIIYNVTIKIDATVHDTWVTWMRDIHIPEVMATACFSAYRFLHLEGYDDDEGITYAIQYTCPGTDLLDIYLRDHAPSLQKKHQALFEGQFVAFRTLLRVVDEG